MIAAAPLIKSGFALPANSAADYSCRWATVVMNASKAIYSPLTLRLPVSPGFSRHDFYAYIFTPQGTQNVGNFPTSNAAANVRGGCTLFYQNSNVGNIPCASGGDSFQTRDTYPQTLPFQFFPSKLIGVNSSRGTVSVTNYFDIPNGGTTVVNRLLPAVAVSGLVDEAVFDLSVASAYDAFGYAPNAWLYALCVSRNDSRKGYRRY